MVEPVELHTERLVLSTPVAADIDAITAACQDPLIQRWTTVPSPYTRTDAENFVNAFVTAGWQSATTRTWAIRRRCGCTGRGPWSIAGSAGPGKRP
jgi:RimJ/RimL family protein N-acetyltransferase